MREFKHPAEFFKKKIVFQTPRLLLRKIESGDCSDMYCYSSREQTTRYLLWNPHPGEYATRAIIDNLRNAYREGTYFELAVVLRETGKMIGTCGITSVDESNFCAEVGYVLSPDYWGQGIAAEAAAVLINFAFCELGAHRVEARFMKGNENSRRVMEKCGMSYEGMQRGKIFVKGEFKDIGTCALTAEEYFSEAKENLYRKFNNSGLFESIFNRFK
ncbi:MAG: GNAT family N-acetyltransferase [Clostridia bacterium]|nr:GNAT family N-acetyltransferase [Clostridia bacterium]